MAVVLDPFYSSKARGSIGGITASRSGVGAVLRRKSKPPLRRRGNQPKIRSILGWCARQYGELTAGERDEWEAYATNHPQPDGFGGTFILTPEQAYLMLNIPAVHRGTSTALQTSPPADPPPATLIAVGAVDGAASGEVKLTFGSYGTPDAGDFVDAQRAGPFQSPGRVEVHSRYRASVKLAGTTFEYTYAGLIPEMYYWFRARYIDKYGQTTNWMVTQYKAPTIV